MANEEGKGGNPKELAKAMSEAKAASESVTRSFEAQLNIIMQMRDAMTQVTKNMRVMCEMDCAGMSPEKWDEVTKAVEKTGTATNDTTESVKKMSEVMQSRWTKAAMAGAAALDGLAQGLKNVAALSKAAVGVFSSMIGGLGSIAASIIAIPFKLITGLFDMAQKGGGGNELAAAYEEVRKEFGSFKSESSKAIIDTAVNMDKMNQTGISTYRVFGNAAERLKAVKEMAVGMGAAFQVFGPEVDKNGTAIMMYNKGLGITNEQMAGLASNAMRMGKGIADVQLDMTKQALGMSKAFGVNAKVISKDMGKAMQDLAHFGHLSTKELAVAATFANKLGVSVDKLTGIMDATATFDQAAEGMSKLNEQFGTNIDATEIMSAQNPAEKVEMLRKEFARTGKDMAKMSYQERMLIKQTTGLGDEALNAAFSAKNVGVSLDKMASQADKNEKKTMNQADAMKALADSIERLTPSGGGGGGGLLNHLFQGFLRGIQGSPEFIKLMTNIRQILWETTQYGVKLGKMFVELFPGVKQFLGGLSELFEPKRFRKLFEGITKAFDVFKDGGTKSMEDFMRKINENFIDFFNAGKPAGKKVIEGFKKFILVAVNIFGKLAEWAIPKVADAITAIANWIRNPVIPNAAGVAEGASNAFLVPLAGAFSALKDKLWPAITSLVEALFSKVKEGLLHTKVGQGIIVGAIATVFLPAISKGLLGLASSKALGKASESVGSSIAGKIFTTLADVGSTGIKSAASKIFESGEKFSAAGGAKGAEGVGQVGMANKAAGEAVDKGGKGDSWGVQDAVKLGAKLVAVATAISIGGIELALAVWAISKILGKINVVPALEVVAALALATVPVALSMKILSKAGDPGSLAIGGAILIAATGIIGIAGILIATLFSSVKDVTKMEAAGNMMLKMSLVFLAMIPVVSAAALLGAAASATGGVAVAAAAAGLALIGAAVAQMALTSQKIVESLATLKMDAGFQAKIDAFLGIMRAIQAFTETLVSVIGMMQPSIIDLMPGGPKQKFTEKIDAAKQFIDNLIGDSSKGLLGMIESIMGVIARLNFGGPQMLQSAQTFSVVMDALAKTLTALTPSPAFFEAGGGFLARLSGGSFSDVTYSVTTYAQGMGNALLKLLTGDEKGGGTSGLLGIVEKLVSVKIPKESIEQARTVAEIISSIANITKALTPDPETLKSMQTSGTDFNYAWGLIKSDSKAKGIDPATITKMMSDKVENVKGVIDAITSGPLQAILSKDIPKEKLEGMKVIADIMKIVVNLATAIGSTAPKGNITIGPNAVAVVNAIPSVTQVLEGMKSSIGGLIDNLVEAVKRVPKDAAFTQSLDKAKTLFGFISEIPKMTESLGGSPGTPINTDPWVNAVAATSMFLYRIMFGGGAFGTSQSPLTELVAHLGSLGNLMTGVDSGKTKQSFEKVKTILTSVGEAASIYSATITQVKDASDKIGKNATGGVLDAIGKMVAAANEINAQLSTLPVINVNERLSAVAAGYGLGSKGEYKVQNKDVVIQLNINVSMDVNQVEQVIISRHNSIIRDRINYAIEKGGRKDQNAANAMIKSTGPQTGFPGRQFST